MRMEKTIANTRNAADGVSGTHDTKSKSWWEAPLKRKPLEALKCFLEMWCGEGVRINPCWNFEQPTFRGLVSTFLQTVGLFGLLGEGFPEGGQVGLGAEVYLACLGSTYRLRMDRSIEYASSTSAERGGEGHRVRIEYARRIRGRTGSRVVSIPCLIVARSARLRKFNPTATNSIPT